MKMINKLSKYKLKNYILKFNHAKWLIPLTIVLSLTSSCIEMRVSSIESAFGAKKFISKEILIQYLFEKIFASTSALLGAYFSTILISSSFQKAMKIYFLEYINLRFLEFKNIGVGPIQSSINRRSRALTTFLTLISIRFMVNVIFLMVILYKISLYISLYTIYKLIFVTMCFMIFVVIIQRKRATFRTFINKSAEENSTKILDILINQERIISFNNKNLELKKYRKVLFNEIKYRQIYECSYVAIRYIINVGLTIAIVLLYKSVNDAKNNSRFSFESLIFVASRLRATVNDILIDCDKVYTTFYNFSKSGIKKSQYDLSNRRFLLKNFNDRFDIIDLSFNFGKTQIFNKINCKINKGEKIAICGPNSSGKSTFARLLMGLYDYKGAIMIDGIEQKQIKEKSMLKHIGYVPQEQTLFNTSIINNLKLGNLEADNYEIIKKCKKFNYHNIFTELDYSRSVGQLGSKLSGGQKQRINFMRAVIKSEEILILDEAAASLDTQSEIELIENIKRNIPQCTLLSIVKNLDTIKYFDRIFYFDNGKLQFGTFEELLETNFKNFYFSVKENSII